MDLDYSHKSKSIISWIKSTVNNAGFSGVVIALSGGIDSSVSATLAVKAFGTKNVHVLLLPYGSLNKIAVNDAKLVTKFLKLPKENIHQIDIKNSVDEIIKEAKIGDKKKIENIRIGNIMARIRMVYLYDFAKKLNSLVIGTENKSEFYLGYFTRFGDEASDIEPIRGLYKTQVWEMGKFLKIPQKIIKKEPTAGLWEGQADEKEFGFLYKDADGILYHYFDEGLPEEAIANLGIDKDLIRKVLSWVEKNSFKHELPKVFTLL